MNVISVICKGPDVRLHLAPIEVGLGASAFTLCLERWKDREPAREGVEFCPECIEKWAIAGLKEIKTEGAQHE